MTLAVAPAGALEGVQLVGASVFLGIPYGRPPTGELRFRPPVAADPWPGTRAAKKQGPSCPQDPNEPGIPHMPLCVGVTDEDCLYLNVWTPAADSKARPVLFWVHGGGCYAGSGSEPFYEGAALAAEQDLVVVTINYRLGALGGFVYFNELGDTRLAESANVGLLDIVLALTWVRRNISAFGGDPDCVTVAGQSAGGHLVGALMGMSQARGLFHRVILQSPGSPHAYEREEGQSLTDAFLRQFGSSDPARIVRATPQELYLAAGPLVRKMTMGPSGPPIGPTLDGVVLREQPLQSIAAGMAKDVPVLAGSTTHELELILRRAGLDAAGNELLQQIAQMFPDPLRERIVRAYSTEALVDLRPSSPGPIPFFFADRMVRLGVVRLLEAQSKHQPRCFAYLLEWQTLVGSGAPHCMDNALLFGTTPVHDVPTLLGDGRDLQELARMLRSRWASFMRTGDPGLAGTTAWPSYTQERRTTFVLGSKPRALEDPWAVQRVAWQGVASPGSPVNLNSERKR